MKIWKEIRQDLLWAIEDLNAVAKSVQARHAVDRADKEDCAAIHDGLSSAASILDVALQSIHYGLVAMEE